MQSSDGSIMITGGVSSNDGDVSGNHGSGDLWVVKLSPTGTIVWQRAYGGSRSEAIGVVAEHDRVLLETSDGGFVIAAETDSDDGDVVGYHTGSLPVTEDCWVFKIDAAGELEWSRALGGSGSDSRGDLILTTDGGYLLNFLSTESGNGGVANYHGGGDCFLVKLDVNGEIEWTRTIGGSQHEVGSDVMELDNGDILMLGTTASNDGDISGNHGGNDMLLSKLNSSGDLLWARTYGGSMDDAGLNLVRASDGGFLLTGISSSSDGDLNVNAGGRDIWLVKVDDNGTLLWQRTYGGTSDEFVTAEPLEGGGYLLAGSTYSNDGDIQGNHGDLDFWLCKVSNEGDPVWQRCLGGSQYDAGLGYVRPVEDGFVALGSATSNDGDVSGNHGAYDMWVVKLRVEEPNEPEERLACAMFIPTAFSPNASDKNDRHCVHGTDCVSTMTFKIFDRWGNKVFESTDLNACWDGQYKGQLLDSAVFVYHLNATLINGEVVERQGNITLVR